MKNDKRIFVGIDLSNIFSKLIPMLRTTIEDENKLIRWVSGKNLHLTLSLAKFEDLVIDLVERTIDPCLQAIKDAGLSNNDIDEVILVGGSNSTSNHFNLFVKSISVCE